MTTDEDGNAALVAFLTAVYAQKPATGDVYAIFRLNMDSDPGLQQEIKRWRILLAETGDTAPTLRMVIPVIPEPASAIMTLAGLSLISSRRRSSRR